MNSIDEGQPQRLPGTATSETQRERIAPETQIGPAVLAVADLDRSLAFYTGGMGMALLARDATTALVGAGEAPLLLLREQRGAQPFPGFGVTGLYHFAVLVPSRADLGGWLRAWLEAGYPLPGQGDHLVSEALYLSDPDGNGIEVYRDRPRETWRWSNGHVQMATDPVDLRGLLEAYAARGTRWEGLPRGTRLGHIHLQVGDIAQARAFYADILGFDVTAQLPSALFVSAGGYHHHIGLNTWQSRGAEPAPADTAGLRAYTLEVPSEEARAAIVQCVTAAGLVVQPAASGAVVVHDPWQNAILLHVGPVTRAQAATALSLP